MVPLQKTLRPGRGPYNILYMGTWSLRVRALKFVALGLGSWGYLLGFRVEGL